MLLSQWLQRHANYQRRSNVVRPALSDVHTVEYRPMSNGRMYKKKFHTDAEMQAFIAQHRRVEVWSAKAKRWVCTQKGDWSWFACYINNILIETE